MKRAFGGLMAMTLCLAAPPALADDAPDCPTPKLVQGFHTCADVDKAGEEGALVFYATDIEQGTVKVLHAFEEAFPKIKTSYIRLQAGALYSRLLSERQGGNNLVDVFQIGDVGLAMDFQKRGGYAHYVSPEIGAYPSQYRSQPAGYFTWGVLMLAGIAYNPKVVTPADAPKDWTDLLDPRWTGVLSMKSAASGMQHVTWYELKQHYGDKYWGDVGKQTPRAFDSMTQQFDRLVNGDDKVAMTAQYSAYLEYKNKGAPVAFVIPKGGMPAGPEVLGVVATAPHPNAARLYVDWFLSTVGQKMSTEAWYFHSPRTDVPPPPGAEPVEQSQLLFPTDWTKYSETQTPYLREMRSVNGGP